MKILLYILSSVLIIWFLIGIISASIVGSKKKRKKFASKLFLSFSDDAKSVLLNIFKLHNDKNVDSINKIVDRSTHATNEIISVLSPENRPQVFSSGKRLDKVCYNAYAIEFMERGYTSLSASILAGIYLFELESILNKEKDENRQISEVDKISVFDKQGGVCQSCDKKFKDHGEPDYHHREMHSLGGKTSVDNIIILCNDCHHKVHGSEKVKLTPSDEEFELNNGEE